MAEYCEKCKELQDRLDKLAASRQSRSKALLDAVLMANNQWRLEMWCLRLDEATSPRMRDLIKVIMDRQIELEDEAKASNKAICETGE